MFGEDDGGFARREGESLTRCSDCGFLDCLCVNSQEAEELNFVHTSAAEWDREEARDIGARNTEAAWVCTDRDVWHENPYYNGPPAPHPEYGEYEDPPANWVPYERGTEIED